MSKQILVIPDIHGRRFWREPVHRMIDDVDRVVFLGDYLDPYPDEGVVYSPEELRQNLTEIVALKQEQPEKVVQLKGNHDQHYALRIVSRMVDSLKDMQEKQDIIDKVYAKLCRQHNNDYNQLWLQNITYTQDKQSGNSPYTMRLCKLVMGENDQPIWNNDWLKPSFVENMPYDTVVNEDTLKNVTPVIVFREQRAYLDAFDGMEDFLEEMSEIAENQ